MFWSDGLSMLMRKEDVADMQFEKDAGKYNLDRVNYTILTH